MIKIDIIPNMARSAPPESPTAAAGVIRHVINDADSMYGLIGCVFKDVDQFTTGMSECGINLKLDELIDNGTVTTYKADARDADGTEWRFILNQSGKFQMTVVNAKLMRVGRVDPETSEFIKNIQQTLTGEEL